MSEQPHRSRAPKPGPRRPALVIELIGDREKAGEPPLPTVELIPNGPPLQVIELVGDREKAGEPPLPTVEPIGWGTAAQATPSDG